MPGIEVIPSARRLMVSLRDMGYDFAQAVADVVDNSLTAEATEIQIDVEFDGDNSWVRLIDNGSGMKADVLKEAMRYGAERDYDDEDLGKFGLGLKTASLSQCQRLTVASRWLKTRPDISAFSWDLDHIQKTNRWEILRVPKRSSGPSVFGPLEDHTGTVVLWERLDRILGYRHPYGDFARQRLAQMCRDLEQHLGMVLHRFLSGEAKSRKKVRLTLNANDVRPWDPFCRSEPKTDRWEPHYLTVDDEGAKGTIRVEPFILPHQSDFSSQAAFRIAAGPNGWNQQQGFYFYRAGRLIQSGGWSRLRAPDEHTKLARLAVSFSPALDEAFKINVAKMRVQVPQSIREELEEIARKVAKAARQKYDRKEARTAGESSKPAPSSARGDARSTESPGSGEFRTTSRPSEAPQNGARPEKRLTLQEWITLTLDTASRSERPHVRSALDRLKSQIK